MVPITISFMRINNKTVNVFRNLHRDIGYLFIGLILIYAVSGIILNMKKNEKDPAYKEISYKESVKKDLMPNDLKKVWSENFEAITTLNRVVPSKDYYRIFLNGGVGTYQPLTGEIQFTIYKKRPLVKAINNIHTNAGKRFTWLANIFGVCMIFLALSGPVMLRGKYGFRRRGWWLISIGLVVPVIIYMITT